MITIAHLIPDVHWKVSAGGGWDLQDEAADAERQASQVRIEHYETSQPLCLAVLTHPFWTTIPASELALASTPRELERGLRGLVDAARQQRKHALAAVVCTPDAAAEGAGRASPPRRLSRPARDYLTMMRPSLISMFSPPLRVTSPPASLTCRGSEPWMVVDDVVLPSKVTV